MLFQEQDFSFAQIKQFLVPLTTKKAIYWIIIIGIFVFGNSLCNSFVYDDDLQIINNPLVHSLANIHYFFMGGTFFDEGSGQIIGIYYKPFLSTVYTFLYSFFGNNPLPFHFFQLVLHILNTIFVYILFRKFFKNILSFLLALVFLVHTLNQEVVAYISDLQDTLFFFFGMLALLFTIQNTKKIKTVILINLFLFLGLLSKETAILFVPTIFLYRYLFNKGSFQKIYFFSITVTVIFYLYLHFFVAHLAKITNTILPIMKLTLLERMISMPAIIFYYIKNFFFPNNLALQQVWVVTHLTFSQFYLPLFIDGAFFMFISIFGIMLWKTNKKLFWEFSFFLLWLMCGLLMHLQIIPLDATVAPRWFYFSMVGLLGILGTILSTRKIQNIRLRHLLITSVVLFTIFLARRTILRNTNWVNAMTLCNTDLPSSVDSYSFQSVCAGEFLKAKKFDEAKKHYAIATKLAPSWGVNWYQYGLSYEYTGDRQKAKGYYLKSIQLSNEVNAYVSLTAMYLKYDNNPQEAKKIVKNGLKSYPNYQRLQLYLAVCEYRLHNKQKALEIATKAYEINPSSESQYVVTQIMHDQEIKLQ